MCIILYTTHAADSYIWRQYPVQLIYKLPRIHLAWEIAMSHHTLRIHPGIGTPGTCQRHRLPHKLAKGLFEHLLYRYCIGLYLPAMVCSTIVGEVYEIAWHQISFLRIYV